jgi:hypothetical protein
MTFEPAQQTENYDMYRLVTPSGKWELGLWRVLFGVRVRFSQVGSCGCVLDYCAGDDALFQMELLEAVRTILKKVPEDTPQHVIQDMFPGYHIKPINRDPQCWPAIQALAAKIRDSA